MMLYVEKMRSQMKSGKWMAATTLKSHGKPEMMKLIFDGGPSKQIVIFRSRRGGAAAAAAFPCACFQCVARPVTFTQSLDIIWAIFWMPWDTEPLNPPPNQPEVSGKWTRVLRRVSYPSTNGFNRWDDYLRQKVNCVFEKILLQEKVFW